MTSLMWINEPILVNYVINCSEYINCSWQLISCSFVCYSFSRKKTISDHSEEWRSLSQQWHILVAAGQLYTPDTSEGQNVTLMRKHFKKAASNCKCNVTLCSEQCDCPDGFKYQLVKLHGG